MKEEEEDGGLFLSPQIVSKTVSKTQDSEQICVLCSIINLVIRMETILL